MKTEEKKNLNKWINKINNTIQSFLLTIDEEYTCEMGKDFCAYTDLDMINWSIIYTDKSGINFYNNFINRFPIAKNFNLFTLSILHEIGHLETENEMYDDTNINIDKLTDNQYFALHNEKIATDWAGEWIENNFDKAKKINTILTNILESGYNKLLIE